MAMGLLALAASVVNTAMLSGGVLLVYRGFIALGTGAADDAPAFFIVGAALVIMGLVNAARLAGMVSRVVLTRGQDLELKQAAGLGTAREPIEPERTSVWFLYPVALLLLWGGLATIAALFSSPPSRSVDQPWLILAAMRAVFGVGLALAGAILALAVSRRTVDAIEDARLRAAYPDSPWRWRSDWALGRIRDERGAWLLLGWPLAFLVAGFALQVAATVFAQPVELDARSIGGIVLLAGVSLGLFIALALATARRLKYGRSELVLHTVPVVIGGALSGRVEAPIRNVPVFGQ
jgi:hypothetical protein